MSSMVADKVQGFFEYYPLMAIDEGEVLVYGGDEPGGVFYLEDGQVQQYDISENGEQSVVNVFKSGAFFPMSWAINATPNEYFFEALTDVKYRLAPKNAVIEFIKRHPDVMYDLLSRVYSGVDAVLRRSSYLMAGDARSRLVFELFTACRRYGEKQKDGSCVLSTSLVDLAHFSGLTRETVSRQMSALKQKDIVSVSRSGTIVHDCERLKAELTNHIG